MIGSASDGRGAINGKQRFGTMDGKRTCSAENCANAAVTKFVQRDLCLNHFVSRCYADLERLDRRVRNGEWNLTENSTLKAFAEECSLKALEISLSGCATDNLQRGRLLDILLWAGEILPVRARVEGVMREGRSSEQRIG